MARAPFASPLYAYLDSTTDTAAKNHAHGNLGYLPEAQTTGRSQHGRFSPASMGSKNGVLVPGYDRETLAGSEGAYKVARTMAPTMAAGGNLLAAAGGLMSTGQAVADLRGGRTLKGVSGVASAGETVARLGGKLTEEGSRTNGKFGVAADALGAAKYGAGAIDDFRHGRVLQGSAKGAKAMGGALKAAGTIAKVPGLGVAAGGLNTIGDGLDTVQHIRDGNVGDALVSGTKTVAGGARLMQGLGLVSKLNPATALLGAGASGLEIGKTANAFSKRHGLFHDEDGNNQSMSDEIGDHASSVDRSVARFIGHGALGRGLGHAAGALTVAGESVAGAVAAPFLAVADLAEGVFAGPSPAEWVRGKIQRQVASDALAQGNRANTASLCSAVAMDARRTAGLELSYEAAQRALGIAASKTVADAATPFHGMYEP